jgi:P27 family predicted phage terminase small subunit
MRGRKPKPTALKLLTGNAGKRRLNQSEPKPPIDIPDCPEHLTEPARTEWERITPILKQQGLVTRLDRAALAAYCQNYARLAEAEGHIKPGQLIVKTSFGPIPNPYLGVANRAYKLMKDFLTEFGLTPVSRSRISGAAPPAGSNEADEKRFLG